MNVLVLVLGCFAAFALAYFTYGRFIGLRILGLDPKRPTPAHEFTDGIDFLPSRTPVLFGHHFASIAGLGPILGPAIAVVWGWLPAILWVVLGCIFVGAVHDLGALAVSVRHRGQTIGDVCEDLIAPRARLLALLIIFFLLALAMGAFVNVISQLFVRFNPDAIIPSFGLMVVAILVGLAVYKYKAPLSYTTAAALVVFGILIGIGAHYPVVSFWPLLSPQTQQSLRKLAAETTPDLPRWEAPYGATGAAKALEAKATMLEQQGKSDNAAQLRQAAQEVTAAADKTQFWWIVALLAYACLASVLPVWLLLQPRDYINSFQLYFALGALTLGIVVAGLTGAPESIVRAAAFRATVPLRLPEAGQTIQDVGTAPSWLPLLFVTIACGAVSGFHSLVSSGTTARQLDRETDALPVGYGAMLIEGVLAVLVIAACVAGLGQEAWTTGPYASWLGIKGGGVSGQLNAVVRGGGNFLKYLGIPVKYGTAILAVTVVAFALTTLDTATRLLRFNVESICRTLRLNFLANRYFCSVVAVLAIAFFGLVPAGRVLWTLFGTTNQLLAGLTLLVVSVYLARQRKPVIYTLGPMLIMLVLSVWAIGVNMVGFWSNPQLQLHHRISLTIVTVLILLMSGWLVLEGVQAFWRLVRSPEKSPKDTHLENAA